MSDYVDEQVNAWILQKFIENKYDPQVHGPIESLSVMSPDIDWECGCYSSWTRDDEIVVTAVIEARGGNVNFRYGSYWDLPEFISYMAGELEDSGCSIESYRRANEDE